jgi:hypothetical protein
MLHGRFAQNAISATSAGVSTRVSFWRKTRAIAVTVLAPYAK